MTKKLLFIRYKINDGIAEGGEILSQTNLNVIRSILGNEQIDEYAIHDISKRKFMDKLKGFFLFFCGMYYGITSSKLNELNELAQNYEIIYIDRSIFGIIAKFLKTQGYKGKIISFFHNFEPIYFKDKLSSSIPFKSIIINCVRKNERWACQYSDIIIALNQRDNNLIQNHYKRAADILIPISFEDKYTPSDIQKQRSLEEPPLCLFFGTNFSANTNGLLWFIKEVLPHVNIRLQIVGKGMEKIKSQLPNDSRIELYGSVPDLKEFIENADIVLSPIFKGSGMKVKTCEALMYGKHIIGSTEAFTGYDIDFEKVGALANTKEEYIEAIKRLSTSRHQKYNAYSREFFLENHSEEMTKKKFEKILLP
jgi:glycosyltransferase involved in cell wall biosynthesis